MPHGAPASSLSSHRGLAHVGPRCCSDDARGIDLTDDRGRCPSTGSTEYASSASAARNGVCPLLRPSAPRLAALLRCCPAAGSPPPWLADDSMGEAEGADSPGCALCSAARPHQPAAQARGEHGLRIVQLLQVQIGGTLPGNLPRRSFSSLSGTSRCWFRKQKATAGVYHAPSEQVNRKGGTGTFWDAGFPP